jgi:hypothetical protein
VRQSKCAAFACRGVDTLGDAPQLCSGSRMRSSAYEEQLREPARCSQTGWRSSNSALLFLLLLLDWLPVFAGEPSEAVTEKHRLAA